MKTENAVALDSGKAKQDIKSIRDTAVIKDTQRVVLAKEEPIVIPDECGDTLWDAVLTQEKNK
jgi:predicted RNase H-like nuclease